MVLQEATPCGLRPRLHEARLPIAIASATTAVIAGRLHHPEAEAARHRATTATLSNVGCNRRSRIAPLRSIGFAAACNGAQRLTRYVLPTPDHAQRTRRDAALNRQARHSVQRTSGSGQVAASANPIRRTCPMHKAIAFPLSTAFATNAILPAITARAPP